MRIFFGRIFEKWIEYSGDSRTLHHGAILSLRFQGAPKGAWKWFWAQDQRRLKVTKWSHCFVSAPANDDHGCQSNSQIVIAHHSQQTHLLPFIPACAVSSMSKQRDPIHFRLISIVFPICFIIRHDLWPTMPVLNFELGKVTTRIELANSLNVNVRALDVVSLRAAAYHWPWIITTNRKK